MKKIALKHDITVPGYGQIEKDTKFKVTKFNSRFVYVEVHPGLELQLARKTDCNILY